MNPGKCSLHHCCVKFALCDGAESFWNTKPSLLKIVWSKSFTWCSQTSSMYLPAFIFVPFSKNIKLVLPFVDTRAQLIKLDEYCHLLTVLMFLEIFVMFIDNIRWFCSLIFCSVTNNFSPENSIFFTSLSPHHFKSFLHLLTLFSFWASERPTNFCSF